MARKKTKNLGIKVLIGILSFIDLILISFLVFGVQQQAYVVNPSLQTSGLSLDNQNNNYLSFIVSWQDNNILTWNAINNPNTCASNEQYNVSFSYPIQNGLSVPSYVYLYTVKGSNYPFSLNLPADSSFSSQVVVPNLKGCTSINGNTTLDVPLTYNASISCNMIAGSTGIDWTTRYQYCSGNNCPIYNSGFIMGGYVDCNLYVNNINGNLNGQQVPVYLYNDLSGSGKIYYFLNNTQCVDNSECQSNLCQNYQCAAPVYNNETLQQQTNTSNQQSQQQQSQQQQSQQQTNLPIITHDSNSLVISLIIVFSIFIILLLILLKVKTRKAY